LRAYNNGDQKTYTFFNPPLLSTVFISILSSFDLYFPYACKLLYLVKVKAVPLQAWSGPEGSRKLSFADFVTTAQDGGEVVSLTHRPPLPPGNIPGTHFY
jgi:hypothetical protein